jgi:hypothetical protein
VACPNRCLSDRCGHLQACAITDTTITPASVVHTLCAAIVVLTFPLAASLVAGSLAHHQDWVPVRRWLLWATALVWFSLLTFFAWSIISNLINPTAGRFGPKSSWAGPTGSWRSLTPFGCSSRLSEPRDLDDKEYLL